ncbi:ribosomal protection-like ABC-F family protein [Nonomuraea sp. NPDC047897]|uniref:ribosomal protection-like ABC-F family protein n=1 Tax=Nonomuraea sp. NPDC047897 TaxID=3364346 RepID=UPI00371F5EBA
MEFPLTILRNVSKSYDHRRVLSGVSLSVRQGERLGIVGDNGSGKSTLLRLLAGIELPDDGQADPGGDVGHLGQTLDLPPEHTVQQAVDAALAPLRAMERRMRDLETAMAAPGGAEAALMDEYGELLTAYEARGGYEADSRVDKSLHGLGLSHLPRDRALAELSGGERARLGLACLLAASPETLLLDEPTNHLDVPAVTWLEERLRDHRGPVVVVSHDRLFLDRVVTAVIEVEDGAVTRYGGGYSGFLAAKAAARARREQAYADWCEEVRQVRERAATTAHRVAAGREMRDNNKMAYDRNAGRVQSSISSRVRNAQERLRRLEADPVLPPPRPLRFRGAFGDAPATGRVLAELRDVRVGDRLQVDALTITAGERLLVHGANGAGKSTLLHAIAERARCRVGHLEQETAFDPGLRILDAYGHGHPAERRAALLATGLFRPETLDLRVGALSEGQRRRLALARLLATPCDLLLLDEPTNHLSLDLVEELEQALDRFPGALVVVTHDRALRQRFRGRELEMSGGHLC